jgi:hypothetical protein
MQPTEVCAINVNSNYCRCALYDFSYGKLKAVGEAVTHDLQYCHKTIGLNSQGWQALNFYLLDIYKWKDKHYKTNKNFENKINDNPFSELLE